MVRALQGHETDDQRDRRVDIDQNNQTPYKLGVRGVPTVMLFRGGQVVAQKVGLPRKGDLTALLDAALLEKAG
jgi:thioredoxin 1